MRMINLRNQIVSVFVILIVALIIIPLPSFILDVMFIINIVLSLWILLNSMYIKDSLEFSIFPSLLLITTLFRLGLNISSTRLILTKGGDAGQVIKTFGDFVLSGNIVVGFIVFLIIVAVQFLVITKGAERVAEVSARFTLDAMPGKQMAIDADLSSGLINEEEARLRRSNIQREAEFYGSMDGATKFVKGDAMMSIIITAINFIGGMIIGMVQGGGDFQTVLSTYSIATVGDGLVSQIPALLISTATGMIVTRAASESSLGTDLSKQFMAQPTVLIIAGIALAALGLIPGMPKIQTFIIAGGLIFLGIKATNETKKAEEPELAEGLKVSEDMSPQSETEYYRNIDNVYELLAVDAIEMNFGYSLIPLVDQGSGSNFIDRLVMFRKQFAIDMGMVIPAVRLRDDGSLNPNQYVIKIRGEEISKGEILVDYVLALDPGGLTGEIDGIETIEPAYGIPSKWITPDRKDMAEIYGYTVIDPLSVVVTHLSETVKRHAYELITRQDINQLLENLKKNSGLAVDEIIPAQITLANFQKVIENLLKEGVPIRDMEIIVETISAHSGSVRDVELLTEHVRQTLKRTITRKWSEGGQIRVITLDSEVEKVIINSIKSNEQGSYLNIDPDSMQSIMSSLMESIKKVKEVISVPIILTSPIVRIYFSKMLDQFAQNAIVLSYNELDTGVQIQAVANVTMQAKTF
ncbi:MAG: flagellar biosynthesis protein FlhA [Clostridia bacterium]|nr:flagellar biosynthesis protein FlhA [Clostridia bacterium]